MTNEEIYKTFLKESGDYEYCKENFLKGASDYWKEKMIYERDSCVSQAITQTFVWSLTEQGSLYWKNRHEKWLTLINAFNISGKIDLVEVFDYDK